MSHYFKKVISLKYKENLGISGIIFNSTWNLDSMTFIQPSLQLLDWIKYLSVAAVISRD